MSSAADRPGLLLAVAYLAAALHGLGAADIVGDDEAREAGIVQEIVRGDVLLPRFNGESIPDKPILYHWLAAVPCAVAGFSETAVRLPSALAGVALVAWTARFGTELLGAPAGVVAALLLATTPSLFDWTRVARPDVLLVLLLSVALGLAFRWWRDGSRSAATAALAALGAATLAKGPVAPALFALTLGGFLLWQGEVRRLPRLVTAPGLAAFLVLGLGWYALALAGWGNDFVHQHLVGRYLFNLLGELPEGGTYSRHGLAFHVLFYPKHLLAIALPWTPFVAVALWRCWRSDRLADARVRFLVCWAAAPVAAFTLAQWKLRYYLLPSLPALALLGAPLVVDLWRRPRPRVPRAAAAALVAMVAAVAGLGALVAASGRLALSASDRSVTDALVRSLPAVGPAGLATLALAGTAAVAAAVARYGWRAVIGTAAATMAAWMAAGVPRLAKAVSDRDSLRPFAVEVRRLSADDARLAFYPLPMRPVVVYLGRHVPTLRRRELASAASVITTVAMQRDLERAGVVGRPVVAAVGRAGNLGRVEVVLAPVVAGGGHAGMP